MNVMGEFDITLHSYKNLVNISENNGLGRNWNIIYTTTFIIIWIQNATEVTFVPEFNGEKIKVHHWGRPEKIITGSAYLPYDTKESPLTKELEELVRACRADGLQLIICCVANSYHQTWDAPTPK